MNSWATQEFYPSRAVDIEEKVNRLLRVVGIEKARTLNRRTETLPIAPSFVAPVVPRLQSWSGPWPLSWNESPPFRGSPSKGKWK